MLKQIKTLAKTKHTFVVTNSWISPDLRIDKSDLRARRIMKNPRNKRLVRQLIQELRNDAPALHLFHSQYLVTYSTNNFGHTAVIKVKPHFPQK